MEASPQFKDLRSSITRSVRAAFCADAEEAKGAKWCGTPMWNMKSIFLHVGEILLMVFTKSGESSPVEGQVVEIPIIYGVLAPSQVVVWDFWTIDTMSLRIFPTYH